MATITAPPGATRLRLTRWRGSRTLRTAVRRLLLAVPVVWGATFLTFSLMNLLPGTAADALLGENATPEAVAALNQKLGLDKPFLERYLDWLGHALRGDLGQSLASGQPITDLVMQRLGVSLELIAFAFGLALVAAIVVATMAARRPGGIIDRISAAVSTFGMSVPGFVLALALIFVFAVGLRWVPPLGYAPISAGLGQNLRYLVLPSISLAVTQFAVFNRMLRADIIDQMQTQDYITTARAKGVAPWSVLIRHALRNSMFGLLTVAGMQIGVLIGTTVVIEKVFAIPGVGQQLLFAIENRDVPVVQGIVVLIATVTVLGNLVADLLYTVLDPRVRHDVASS